MTFIYVFLTKISGSSNYSAYMLSLLCDWIHLFREIIAAHT